MNKFKYLQIFAACILAIYGSARGSTPEEKQESIPVMETLRNLWAIPVSKRMAIVQSMINDNEISPRKTAAALIDQAYAVEFLEDLEKASRTESDKPLKKKQKQIIRQLKQYQPAAIESIIFTERFTRRTLKISPFRTSKVLAVVRDQDGKAAVLRHVFEKTEKHSVRMSSADNGRLHFRKATGSIKIDTVEITVYLDSHKKGFTNHW